ncbi:MAG: DUF2130 domain-containing protein [Bacteroidia bacterium]
MKTNVKMCPICGNPVSQEFIAQFELSIKKDLEEQYILKQSEFSKKLERARAEVRAQVQDESLLQIKEKDKLVADLKEQLIKVSQKLENSSQQLKGEVQELELEAILASTFPTDFIEPVGKGIRGADCTQYVSTKSGVVIGKILFESKRVRSFSEGWIDKLKKDNLQAKCDLTVIVTSTMPKEITGKFGIMNGVWICLFEPEAIRQLALVLRYGLLKVYQVNQNHHSSKSKSEKLFQYLTSEEFKRLFENVLEGFKVLEQSFQDERKKLTAYWKLRETQLQEMLTNTLELYSSMKGISPEIQDISTLDDFRQAS